MNHPPATVLSSLNQALFRALSEDDRVVLLGEDILDPYGGSFKVSKGLSTAFPAQVITTPISEAGITGIAGGMALRGLRPVVEIMFGDFSTLIADQVINHITKFAGMYNQQVSVPVLIRTPMGGRRGYGPTHSQSLEKIFLGTPGLTVLAPFNIRGEHELGAPGKLLYEAILTLDSPVFFVENKLQYPLPLLGMDDLQEFTVTVTDNAPDPGTPFYTLGIKDAPDPLITLTAYGYMAHLALEALQILAYQHEIFCELLIPTWLTPFNLQPLFQSVRKTGKLLTLEEGTFSLGWGAEVLARTAENLPHKLKLAGRLAARETVIPAAPELETACLPGIADIVSRVREMV